MREVVADIERWQADGTEPIALATVIKTWGSAPRKTGAKMALTPSGKLSGSVSGGCVEGAVFDLGVEALQADTPQLVEFGVADETAWEVGLACGGSIRVWIAPFDPLYQAAAELMAQDAAFALVSVIGAGVHFGRKLLVTPIDQQGSIADTLDSQLAASARAAIQTGQSTTLTIDETELYIDVNLPAPQLIMVGGVHIAIGLTSMAQTLGYRTVIVDPRRAFGSDERFPHVDQLIQAWPKEAFEQLLINENTAIALLTHDPKIDDPAITQVLDSSAFYIGALGSRKTHAKRVARLKEAGFSDQQIGRIHGPIGLDLNAQNPEEIALSVMGEIVAVRRNATL